jgi:RND family efflux transporter MFP subunit
VNLSTSSGAIVALADLDTLEVEADVAEANVAKLGEAQPAEVTVEAFPDKRYRAVLRQVIPTADRTKATVQVKVTIQDKDPNLKPEMSAKVTFLEPAQPAASTLEPAAPVVTVPREAVATRDGKPVVFVVGAESKVQARLVTTGAEVRGQLTIRSGLSGGEAIVLNPPATLSAGDTVRARKG